MRHWIIKLEVILLFFVINFHNLYIILKLKFIYSQVIHIFLSNARNIFGNRRCASKYEILIRYSFQIDWNYIQIEFLIKSESSLK